MVAKNRFVIVVALLAMLLSACGESLSEDDNTDGDTESSAGSDDAADADNTAEDGDTAEVDEDEDGEAADSEPATDDEAIDDDAGSDDDADSGADPNDETGESEEAFTGEPSDCQVIYDAGSSGTRLFIYEATADGFVEHEGPKVSALADPIRETRGKTFDDAASVVDEVLGALPAMLEDGPLDEGEPEWVAFDWKNRCNVTSASIYATAGMRIAEQW